MRDCLRPCRGSERDLRCGVVAVSNKNNGGPAFPWGGDLNDCPTINLGMTLRDYLAAKVMQGILSNSSIHSISGFNPEREAIDAYMFADAMIKERDK